VHGERVHSYVLSLKQQINMGDINRKAYHKVRRISGTVISQTLTKSWLKPDLVELQQLYPFGIECSNDDLEFVEIMGDERDALSFGHAARFGRDTRDKMYIVGLGTHLELEIVREARLRLGDKYDITVINPAIAKELLERDVNSPVMTINYENATPVGLSQLSNPKSLLQLAVGDYAAYAQRIRTPIDRPRTSRR
jgi:hypothetical protein